MRYVQFQRHGAVRPQWQCGDGVYAPHGIQVAFVQGDSDVIRQTVTL